MITLTFHVRGLDPNGARHAGPVDAGSVRTEITREHGGDGIVVLEVGTDRVGHRLLRDLVHRIETSTGAQVRRIGPSRLLNAVEIAQRLGRTRQSIGQLARGLRGPGGWPPPINPRAGAPLWEWAAVARWANEHLDATIPEREIVTAEAIECMNMLLRLGELQHVGDLVPPMRELARAAVRG